MSTSGIKLGDRIEITASNCMLWFGRKDEREGIQGETGTITDIGSKEWAGYAKAKMDDDQRIWCLNLNWVAKR